MFIVQKIKLKIILNIFLFSCSLVFSQTTSKQYLDSIYFKLIKFYSSKTNQTLLQKINEVEVEKCLFPLVAQIKMNYSHFTDEQKLVINSILQRPITDTSFVSPSGNFRIHFLKNNLQSPKFNVNELANALDSSFKFEVSYLGFLPPPKDNGEGGDNLYDVYILNLGGVYGLTTPENEISSGSNTFYSFIQIDNDFAGFYTDSINAAKVTSAHELHHAIQIGNYILRNSGFGFTDQFFYELTATSMEEFVYDDVNDYYGYLKNYFNFSDLSFAKYEGYEIAIWNIFLQSKFGFEIIKRQWDLMKTNRALNAINNSLIEFNSSFGEQLNQFAIWNFFTNFRYKSGKYFEEAKFYPPLKISNTIFIDGVNIKNVSSNVQPASNNFIRFVNSRVGISDTLIISVSNGDIKSGIDSLNSLKHFVYSLSPYQNEGFSKIIDNYFYKFESDKMHFWYLNELLNNELIDSSFTPRFPVNFAFPSPFSYNASSFIFIPFEPSTTGYIDLNIYSSSMNLILSKQVNVNNNQRYISWDALNSNNEKLSTGIYLFVINSGDKISNGKLVIINE